MPHNEHLYNLGWIVGIGDLKSYFVLDYRNKNAKGKRYISAFGIKFIVNNLIS
jgi:hypothetical protein